MKAKQHQLSTQEATLWMRDSLGSGPSLTLAKLVCRAFPWDECTCWTVADASIAQEKLSDFLQGGKVSGQVADQWLLAWLATVAGSCGEATLVAEDWRADRNSEFLATDRLPAFFYGIEVYYCLPCSDVAIFPRTKVILSNTVPSFHAFVARGDLDLLRANSLEWSAETIQKVAEDVAAIICGAYDGEGFVVAVRSDLTGWTPTELIPPN